MPKKKREKEKHDHGSQRPRRGRPKGDSPKTADAEHLTVDPAHWNGEKKIIIGPDGREYPATFVFTCTKEDFYQLPEGSEVGYERIPFIMSNLLPRNYVLIVTGWGENRVVHSLHTSHPWCKGRFSLPAHR